MKKYMLSCVVIEVLWANCIYGINKNSSTFCDQQYNLDSATVNHTCRSKAELQISDLFDETNIEDPSDRDVWAVSFNDYQQNASDIFINASEDEYTSKDRDEKRPLPSSPELYPFLKVFSNIQDTEILNVLTE